MDDIQQQILDQLKENNRLLSGNRDSGNSAAQKSSGGNSNSSGGVEGFGKLGEATNRLMNSQYKASDALQDGAGIVSKVFPKLGEAFGGTAKYVTDTNEALKQSGKSGVNFAGDLGQARESISGARLTMDQYNQLVRKSSSDMTGLGQGVDQGTKNFLKLNQAVIEQTDVNDSLAQSLMQSGVTADDFSKATQLVTLNSRAGLLQDKERSARAVQSAIELADEMDRLAKITGKSKEQQASDLEKQMRKADVQATLLQMDDQQQQNYKKAQLTFGTLGEGVQDLASEIVTGGVRTKEGAAAMSALGPAGKEFENALKQQMAARTPAEKAAAEASMNLAKQHITEYQSSKEYRDKLAYDRSASGDAARKMFTDNKEMQGKLETAQLIEKKTGAPAKSEDVVAAQQKAADRQTKGQDVDTGKELPGAGTARALNTADMQLGSVSAGLNSKFKQLNDNLAPSPEAIRKFNEALQSKGLGTQEGVNNAIGEGVTAAQDLIGVKPKVEESKMTTKLDSEGNIVKRAGGSPGVQDFLKGGSFDGMFEQFGKGTPAILHGEEMVATKDQMTKMLSGMQGQMQGAMKSAPDQLQGMSEQMQGMMKNMPGVGGSFNVSDTMKGMEGAQGLAVKEPSLEELKKQAMSMSATASTAEKEALSKKIQAATPKETIDKSMLEKKDTGGSQNLKKDIEIPDEDPKVAEMKKAERDIVLAKNDAQRAAAEEKLAFLKKQAIDQGRKDAEERAKATGAVAKDTTVGIKEKTPEPPKTEDFKDGSKDPKVLELQKHLIEAGAKIKADGIMGPLTRAAQEKFGNVGQTGSVTAKTAEIPKVTPPAPKTEEAKPAEADKPKQEEAKSSGPVTGEVTMKDIKDQLVHLNTNIEKLVNHSASSADAAHKQVKATKSLSGNRL